jgi:Ca2+:H+ antiporter
MHVEAGPPCGHAGHVVVPVPVRGKSGASSTGDAVYVRLDSQSLTALEAKDAARRRAAPEAPEAGLLKKREKVEKDMLANGFGAYLTTSLSALLLSSPMNILLLAAPLAFYGEHAHYSDAFIFTTSLLAIAPFAERLSFVTEQLAMHTSQTVGGLLNASFGNVTELIVSLFALKDGLLRIVEVSLLGSILSNLLLVLGCAFFVGGIKYPMQKFNAQAQSVSSGLLLLATMALAFPAVLDATHEQLDDPGSSLLISRLLSVVLLLTYACYLIFQLHSHTHLFDSEEEEDDDDDEKVLGAWGAVFWLSVITVFIGYLSEYMVAAIQGAAEQMNAPDLFLGTIVIPIIGNAAEHAAAIIFAYKNKMELSLGIAVGSAVQIALFVLPACVIVAWWSGSPLSLDFHPFETTALIISVLLVGVLINSGKSNWLSGAMLLVGYVIVSVGFYVHIDLPAEDN